MTSTQLALFDTSTVVVPYKEGDWVRLRKKPKNAFGLKRGDLIQVEKVHPTAGTIKFWNLASESYTYLYPDEVSLAPAPVDSVSESIALDEVDTESIAPVDSVSESIAPAEVDTESIAPVDSVSERCKAISTYRPRGTARGGEYYRFSYRDGSRMKHIHIKGGNTDSPIAIAKVQEVRSLLAAGVRTAEVVEMLRSSA